MEFRGAYTALVTPFKKGGVDYSAFKALLKKQKTARVAGVVPCGCTGEAATLTLEERRELVRISLETVGDDLRVVPGTGTNSTQTTIALTREAEKLGAHAAMLITPYYNKPSQRGLIGHYLRVAEATALPLVLYNVPGRTGVTLAAETVAEIRSKSEITVLSGDDSLTVPMMSVGAKGVVSVISNLRPEAVREMVDYALGGDFERAATVHFQLLPLVRAAFVESNPSPIKAMLSIAGEVENELRAPLAPVSDRSMALIREALEGARAEGGGPL
jgi:4-hydroxy-tetrahydrodipicolinate synthase